MATSKQLVPEYLDYWARLKGITIVGTGDFTHPGWLAELKEKTEPAEPGLLRLKPEYRIKEGIQVPGSPEPRFVLTSEISNIYKKNGRVRKIHNVILAPDFDTVERFQRLLQRRKFNITSDGRPILGLDARDLVAMTFDINENNFFIPAHIWTPWFSALGSKSGFDSIEEAFGDMTPRIHALETGLSSDMPMNWLISELDNYTLVSNSDAHSPEKLGRNANLFSCNLDYISLCQSMIPENPGFEGTIDLFPQEGKYHYAGHRKCNVRMQPEEALRHQYICPVCGKKVTEGVMDRVIELADRTNPMERPNKKPYHATIPLKELLSEIYQTGPNTLKVKKTYDHLLQSLGPELDILLKTAPENIAEQGFGILAEAIQRMRDRRVIISEGFDGQYGVLKVFDKQELTRLQNASQQGLFETNSPSTLRKPLPLLNVDMGMIEALRNSAVKSPGMAAEPNLPRKGYVLNAEQQEAATVFGYPALIIAGPGTGKTRVLIERIRFLINEKKIASQNILALTFSHKAAQEIKERLSADGYENMEVATFHSFGMSLLKEYEPNPFVLISENEKQAVLSEITGLGKNTCIRLSRQISRYKSLPQHQEPATDFKNLFERYTRVMKRHHLKDMEDLLFQAVKLLQAHQEIRVEIQQKYPHVLVDEYQDINYIQHQLLQLLPTDHLFAIGDPNQAIYGFRGADVGFIKNFTTYYPKAKVFRFTRSYRCPTPLLKAAGDVLLDKYQDWQPKTGAPMAVKLKISAHATPGSEAEHIARAIEKAMGGLRFFSMDSQVASGHETDTQSGLADFAVLVRSHNQFEIIAKAFNDHSIPYELVGEESLSSHTEIKKLMQYLSYREGHAISQMAAWPHIEKHHIKDIILELEKNNLMKLSESEPALFDEVCELADSVDNNISRFRQAVIMRHRYDLSAGNDRVRVMTLHASKGLEFDHVFIAGCESGLIPYTLFRKDVNLIEEQNLLYVGMTRAKKQLTITYAERRNINGMIKTTGKSHLLELINKSYLEYIREKPAEKNSKNNQLDLF
jgi:uncharacterized protein (TIGR00375 family)